MNNNYILNIVIKEKLLGYVRLLRYSYGRFLRWLPVEFL